MSEMVEKVAMAICAAREQNGGPPWEYWLSDASGKHVLNAFRDDARAALLAMREPTEVMIDVGDRSNYGCDMISDETERKYIPRIWQAMIDAALQEK